MNSQTPITDLINSFPTRRILADRVGAQVDAVHKWAQKDRIPSDFQARVVLAAQDIGLLHVTPGWMLDIHANWASRHGRRKVAA